MCDVAKFEGKVEWKGKNGKEKMRRVLRYSGMGNIMGRKCEKDNSRGKKVYTSIIKTRILVYKWRVVQNVLKKNVEGNNKEIFKRIRVP